MSLDRSSVALDSVAVELDLSVAEPDPEIVALDHRTDELARASVSVVDSWENADPFVCEADRTSWTIDRIRSIGDPRSEEADRLHPSGRQTNGRG